MSHCNHRRTNSKRKKNGYIRECLSCGYQWFEKDKPKTEADKDNRAMYEHNLELEKKRK